MSDPYRTPAKLPIIEEPAGVRVPYERVFKCGGCALVHKHSGLHVFCLGCREDRKHVAPEECLSPE